MSDYLSNALISIRQLPFLILFNFIFSQSLFLAPTLDEYLQYLMSMFNPDVVGKTMCRSMVTVGWNGQLYDCDFNHALDRRLLPRKERMTKKQVKDLAGLNIWSIESFDELGRRMRIHSGTHCFGCTAGKGSTCNGAIETE